MNIKEIALALERTGYIVLDKPLLESFTAALFARCCNDDNSMRFKSAQIGRGLNKQAVHSVRGDVISWLDDHNHTDHAYLTLPRKNVLLN